MGGHGSRGNRGQLRHWGYYSREIGGRGPEGKKFSIFRILIFGFIIFFITSIQVDKHLEFANKGFLVALFYTNVLKTMTENLPI